MTKQEWLEDIKDAEKDVAYAEEQLKEAQDWLMRRKLYWAELIIRYHNSDINN